MFKKGQKVKVSGGGMNASQFNRELSKDYPKGVYSVHDWQNKVFKIEGKAELTDFTHQDNILCYLLTYEGTPIGYVYSIGIKEYTKPDSYKVIIESQEGSRIDTITLYSDSHSMQSFDKYISDADKQVMENIVTNTYLYAINDGLSVNHLFCRLISEIRDIQNSVV